MCLICLARSIESTSKTTSLSCGLLEALLMPSWSCTEDNYAAEAARKALDGSTIAGAQVAVYDGKCSNKAVLDWRKGLAIA